jgi:alpha-ribazole phosphatase/probable phosphoglycerate mutase
MLRIYLLRHGQTAWNADGNRYCGRTDIPLTEKGIAQAEMVKEQLKNIVFKVVYSSPLERAFKTAQIAAGGNKVIKDERLIEADFGNWEGKTRAEFIQENESLWNNWVQDATNTKAGGNGESASDVVERVNSFFDDLLQQHENSDILVVAHNAVNRFYMAHKLGMNLKDYRRILQENSTITMFHLEKDGEFTLVHLNSKL